MAITAFPTLLDLDTIVAGNGGFKVEGENVRDAAARAPAWEAPDERGPAHPIVDRRRVGTHLPCSGPGCGHRE